MVPEPPSASAKATGRCHSSQLIAKPVEVAIGASFTLPFDGDRGGMMIGAYPGPRQPRVRDGAHGLERSLAKAGTAERGSGAAGGADDPESDGGPRGPAAESSLDHSCGGSGFYRSAIVAPRRRGLGGSRCRFAFLE